MVKTNIRDEAQALAVAHREMDAGTHIIKLFPSPTGDVIQLLEVSTSVATSGTIEPFVFTANPSDGYSHRCLMLLLSDQEWSDVQSHRLSLPAGWDIRLAEDLL